MRMRSLPCALTLYGTGFPSNGVISDASGMSGWGGGGGGAGGAGKSPAHVLSPGAAGGAGAGAIALLSKRTCPEHDMSARSGLAASLLTLQISTRYEPGAGPACLLSVVVVVLVSARSVRQTP